MPKTKYLTIKESDVYKDDLGNKYCDIMTFPIQEFSITKAPFLYTLTQSDIYRFDILISTYYGSADYDDLILWLNNIEHISDVSVGTQIYLLDKEDLDTFYREYLV